MTPAPGIAKINLLLACYSAGSLPPALQAMVASHLEISGANRSFAGALDALQGSGLMQADAVGVGDREAKLAAIFEAEAGDTPARPADPVLPHALRQFIGKDFAEIKWRSRLPGLKEYRISPEGGGEAVLYWIKAGRKVPSHTHHGSEVTLVLKGAFHDVTGEFRRGDLAVADSEINHQPTVTADADCICFAVTDAPLRLTGPVGRIADMLFGHRH